MAEGVLANLPRTRPQRSSARRDAARRATAVKATPAHAPTRKQTTAKKRPAKAKSPAEHLRDTVPRQGFETESEPVSGSVQPPGGVELLASVAELAGELAKTGLSSGGRLLRDVFSRLPLN
jgi:hypothetical protein